ncbi:hypothetical protein, partial [Adlercreutzia sp. ZJ473]|uniref:hypothetical protein n=1 Tax=Adlercreutzia sp. ZJ473 TaxID=2722822 RepID=UPI001C12F2A3
RAAAEAFADPGIAGARRSVGVLGVDAEGNRLRASDAGTAGFAAAGGCGPAAAGGCGPAGRPVASSAPSVPTA